MKSFTSLTLALSALACVSASPIQRRGETVCESEPRYTGTINYADKFFGTDDAVMTTDSKGNQALVLISTKADGSGEYYSLNKMIR